jgi:hypothetical protein
MEALAFFLLGVVVGCAAALAMITLAHEAQASERWGEKLRDWDGAAWSPDEIDAGYRQPDLYDWNDENSRRIAPTVTVRWDPSDIQYPDGSTIRSRRGR